MSKKRISYLLVLVMIAVSYYSYHNFFSITMLTGDYLNTNFEYGSFLADAPYGQDRITLNPDNTFSSTYWGEGEYKIEYYVSGTELILTYDYEYGKAGFHTNIERQFFSKPRIIIFRDMNHYMRKLNN